MTNLFLTETFKLTLCETFKYLKTQSSSFKRIKSINDIDIYAKLANVENVKTIWQVDKSVNLNSFYYPSRIIYDNKEILADSIAVFPENGKFVIEGTAGQGKSILLRYLVGKELKIGSKIPIFIELRKITDRTDLESLLLDAINNLDVFCDKKDLDIIFKSNKFILLFDAFDEIPEANVMETISYMEKICSRYYDQQIIVTSRPGADIQKIHYFKVCTLANLERKDLNPMLSKLFEGSDCDDIVNNIMRSLHENDSDILSLINTPLLLTLLAITYKTYNKVPSQLHEFYENLFHVLVNRHDSTKPGFRREFKSELNEKQLENLFCSFSFFSMIADKTSLSINEANELVSKASTFSKISPSSECAFIRDCVKNTCLILEEGFNYHFIHKSIREYHAARFISKSIVELKVKFYELAAKSIYKYSVELDFLRLIDKHYFNKLYYLPLSKKSFNKLNIIDTFILPDPSLLLSDIHLSFLLNDNDVRDIKKIAVCSNGCILDDFNYTSEFRSKILNEIFSLLKNKIENVYNSDDFKSKFIIFEKSNSIKLVDIFRKYDVLDEFVEFVGDLLKIEFDNYQLIEGEVRNQEKEISDLDF